MFGIDASSNGFELSGATTHGSIGLRAPAGSAAARF